MRQGFTLLELSIVLVIIGTIVAGGLTILVSATQTAQVNKTVAKMEVIDKALLDYATNFYRLPCPSDLTLTATSANYGVEAATKGTCTGSTPAANFSSTSGTVEGGVPVRALQLTDDYMYDGWNRRIRYAVDPSKTASSSLPVGTGTCTSTKSITVNDASGTARTTNAAYALISHGKNGHGAYSSNGVIASAASTNPDEQTNCHCNASAVATTYSPTYVEKLATTDPASALNGFDDIVTFKDAWQLQTFSAPLSSTACTYYIYVADYYNNRVLKFDTSGNFILGIGAGYNGVAGSIGSSGSANGQFYGPTGMVFDASGNLWVADYINYRVQEFNPTTGAYIGGIWPSYGTTAGQLQRANKIAFDSAGYLYVTDYSTNYVNKFTTAGVYQSRFGGTGSGDGQLTSPEDVKFDGSGNIWILDSGNARVQKFSSSGVFVSKFGTYGNDPTQVGNPESMIFDGSGSIWMVERFNNRITNRDTSGAWQSQFACASYDCSNVSGTNGQFSTMETVALDPDGSLWISDRDNYRIQKMTKGGVYIKQIPCATGACSTGSGNTQLNSGVYGLLISNQ